MEIPHQYTLETPSPATALSGGARSFDAAWAKTAVDAEGLVTWHPLALHMLDVAAAADALMCREPAATRQRLGAALGLSWEAARPWLLFIVACHDLGKACPGFQCKWENLTGLDTSRSPNTEINHAFVSQIDLASALAGMGWPEDLAELAADATGCHHGERASPTALDHLMGDRRALGGPEWSGLRVDLWQAVLGVLSPGAPPVKTTLSGPDFMLLAGLVSFADWVGSNVTWFPFGNAADIEDLQGWFTTRRAINAEIALDAIGWSPREPLATAQRSFSQVFGFSPRPLQQAVATALSEISKPSVLLIEAPMGEGKTEAAFYAHLELQRQFKHRGLYLALPTRATGNAMFRRTLKFLQSLGRPRRLDLQLLHGGTALNDDFQALRLTGVHDPESGGEVRAGEWFTDKKRALLSEYGVGTIDQALTTILPVRHQFVRMWGLANRVVVFDEVHAYDAYTGTLLAHLVSWLLALGSSVVLLSATLPPAIRRKLAAATGASLPEVEQGYPRLSIFSPGEPARQHRFEADPARRIKVEIQPLAADLPAIHEALYEQLPSAGLAMVLVNTVQRAQDLYSLFPEGEALRHAGQLVGKRLADGTEVYLFHARYPADCRQIREDHVIAAFGPGAQRTGRKILIATQVAEQSLDLDFDLIVTDLAPIDLLLQRLGRLWRHAISTRPTAAPMLLIAGLAGDAPPSFAEPLWWGAVYREDVLLRTWVLLRTRGSLTVPDDIDSLVNAVYEEDVAIPDSLQDRLEAALTRNEGKSLSHVGQAHQAIIGLPDDASWNDPARFILFDEATPGVHRGAMAQTRLGDDAVVVLPLWADDQFDPAETPSPATASNWARRAVSVSHKSIVRDLRRQGVPTGWKASPLLRGYYPLVLNAHGAWAHNSAVRLDAGLGLTFSK